MIWRRWTESHYTRPFALPLPAIKCGRSAALLLGVWENVWFVVAVHPVRSWYIVALRTPFVSAT